MTVRDPAIFHRALRAAAGVTGVLKRSAAVGLSAGTLALTACGAPSTPTAQPGAPSTPTAQPGAPAPVAGPTLHNRAPAAPPIDAGVDASTVACADDSGWGSPCCEAIDNRSPACMAWGPPAPPVATGERLA
ncbi:MAG: hypothetical protein R3B06_31410 [Kofleriaceae bacterium]